MCLAAVSNWRRSSLDRSASRPRSRAICSTMATAALSSSVVGAGRSGESGEASKVFSPQETSSGALFSSCVAVVPGFSRIRRWFSEKLRACRQSVESLRIATRVATTRWRFSKTAMRVEPAPPPLVQRIASSESRLVGSWKRDYGRRLLRTTCPKGRIQTRPRPTGVPRQFSQLPGSRFGLDTFADLVEGPPGNANVGIGSSVVNKQVIPLPYNASGKDHVRYVTVSFVLGSRDHER